jgi:uncharacterized membrane protein
MQSKARLLGHSVHQMLIVFPLGLLATAVIFDVVQIIAGSPVTATVSYWMIAAGIIGGLVAARLAGSTGFTFRGAHAPNLLAFGTG